MSSRSLYDDDILLWSEEQAEVIRRLAGSRRDLPNEFDAENVAEEIESVGRSELAAVSSLLQVMLLHLMKLALDPASDAARHWKSEIVAFHADIGRRYTPSMRRRMDLDALWDAARDQALVLFEGSEAAQGVANAVPFDLGDLLAAPLSIDDLVERIPPAQSEPTAS